jgi:hypothetical protein
VNIFWEVTVFVVEFEPKIQVGQLLLEMNVTRGSRLLGHFAYLHCEAAGAAAAVRPKSEAQK